VPTLRQPVASLKVFSSAIRSSTVNWPSGPEPICYGGGKGGPVEVQVSSTSATV
jgi:hypothetical protein